MEDNFITRSLRWYHAVLEKGDPRTDSWFMVYSPVPVTVVCLLYVFVVKYVGPLWMANRKPFELRKVLMAYNFAMVVLNAYIFIMGGYHAWFTTYRFVCQDVNVNEVEMPKLFWLFYMTRMIEFLDTMFFVLRKKFNQISVLHVYHHASLPLGIWLGLKYSPGGEITLAGFINSFVHVLMYTYYGLAAVGPHMQKYLWWKKYLTVLQMLQFVVIILHVFVLMFSQCGFGHANNILSFILLSQAAIFFVLFLNFYVNAYRERRQLKKRARSDLTDRSHKIHQN